MQAATSTPREPPVVRVHRAEAARAGLVLAHGVMSHAAWFDPLAEALVARGVTVAAVDRAGSGAARDREGRCDPAVWVDDLVAAASSLRAELPRVALLGWCWGARTAILAASRLQPIELILAAPGLAMAPAVRARAAELAASSGEVVPLPFAIDVFSDDAAVQAWIRRDPLAWSSQPRGFLAPSRALLDDALRVLPTLQAPVTTLLAEGDRIVDNDAVTSLLSPRAVERLPGGHALVLESPARVADRIVAAIAT